MLPGHTSLGSLCCHRGYSDTWTELLPKAMSESMVLLQLGSVLMSTAHVMTRIHRTHACSNPAELSLLPSPDKATGALVPAIRKDSPNSYHCYAPHLGSTLEASLL